MHKKLALYLSVALVPVYAVAQTEAKPQTATEGKEKPKKRKKKRAEPKEPEEPTKAVESTVIEPSLTYRYAFLTPYDESVYHRDSHRRATDQIYMTFKFARKYDYVHEVVLEPSLRTIRTNPQAWDDPIVEQAYLESAFTKRLTLTAGKKTEFEGSGLLVNPSDLLNENKDLFDPLYQKEGQIFTRVRYRRDAYSLGLGFIPTRGEDPHEGRGWLQLGADVAEIDLRLSATTHEVEKTTTGLSVARFFGDHFELHVDARYQARQRDAAQKENLYLKYSAYKREDPSGQYLGGSRLVLTPRRTIIAEYYVNQSGLLPDEMKSYYADLREDQRSAKVVIDPPTKYIGRHYVFLGYQDDDTLTSTHLGLHGVYNTDDASAFVTASARYTLSPLTSFELAPTWFLGNPETEFGELPFKQAVHLLFRGRF